MILYLNADINNGPTWNKRDYLLAAAKRLGWDWWIRPYHKGTEVDFILNIEPYSNFVKGNLWTGVWEIDMALDRAQMSKSDWTASDDVFLANSALPSHMNPFKHKTRLLFQACDPDIHRRIPGIKQEYDIVFSGTNGLDIYRERERCLKLLRQEGTFFDYGKGMPPDKYIACLNTARVQFIRSGKTPVANSWTAQRFFECLPIGPVLADWTEDLQYRLGLVEGEDYYSYKDDAEMILKFTKLIRDPDFANKMAESGRQKALLYHTYEHRLISIISSARQYGLSVPISP